MLHFFFKMPFDEKAAKIETQTVRPLSLHAVTHQTSEEEARSKKVITIQTIFQRKQWRDFSEAERCHVCCHHLSLGSHEKGKGERKMSSLTGFAKKGGQVLQKSSSVFRHILFGGGGGGSGTLWPLPAPMVPVQASVRNHVATVDVPVSFLILRLQHRSSCFQPHGDRTPLLFVL